MTYLQFLLLFLVAPAALLLALHGTFQLRESLAVVAFTAVLFLVLVLPWDHLLVRAGVLEYGAGKVQGRLWRVPYEEYAFFAAQAVFTAALTMLVFRRRWWES